MAQIQEIIIRIFNSGQSNCRGKKMQIAISYFWGNFFYVFRGNFFSCINGPDTRNYNTDIQFWAVELQRKKDANCHKLLLRSFFYVFRGNFFCQKYCSIRTTKLHIIKVRIFLKMLESVLFWVKIGYKLILK